jgi:Bacteriocin-protection, YdeI or OmpD-Associated/Domain of unknown function (DUF1905)
MRYETVLRQTGNNTGIDVPDEVLEALGGGRRPAVAVSANGYRYQTTVGAMDGRAMLPFSAARRAESGLSAGDALTVDIELDTAPRTVDVPEELASALAAAGVRAEFDALAPSKRKAHVTAVTGARAEATRARRIAAIIAGLS